MICTGSYNDFNGKGYNCYSISWDKGKDAGYDGDCYLALAPKKDFFRVWRSNIGKISEEENTRYYIEEYYKQVLSKLDPNVVYNELDSSILLCYENSDEFCHRHVLAAWLNLFLGDSIEPVSELSFIDGKTVFVPECSSRYSDILEDVIKSNENMEGFNSIRAKYLFDKSREIDALASEYEKANPDKNVDSLRQMACYYRCDADEVEANYCAKQKLKKSGE